jgi:hypothetical protein
VGQPPLKTHSIGKYEESVPEDHQITLGESLEGANSAGVAQVVPDDAILDLEEDFDSSEDNGQDDKHDLLEALRSRCDAAKMTYELSVDPTHPWISINFSAGKETRSLYIANAQQAKQLLACTFERISYVGDFEAICSYDEGYIEAMLGGLGAGAGLFRLRELFGVKFARDLNEGTQHLIRISPPKNHPNIDVTLSLQANNNPFLSRAFSPSRPTTISIRNVEITSNDHAIELLETITNSLLFEIDLRFNIPLTLLRQRRLVGGGMGRIDIKQKLLEKPLQFPSTTYDRTALSLYWYGRSAAGLPLLRFLAFYQSLEFYFPTYSQNEAIKQTKKMLKDPRFSIHDDADLARLVNSIQTSRSGSLGDERSQFRSVINGCVDAEALRELLEKDALRSFYTDTKHKWKQVSKIKIPVNDAESDLRTSIAERLYDIRCRIVHAKSDGGQMKSEALLPFSREAEQLAVDTQVIQFISTQTLIASSNKLSF